jgi:hypothetical protein
MQNTSQRFMTVSTETHNYLEQALKFVNNIYSQLEARINCSVLE